MAEKSDGLGFVMRPAAYAFTAVATLVAKAWNAVTADGTLAAAFRQGTDELGVALKAFPDSIQVHETGSVLNPTQGEIAADRKPGMQDLGVREGMRSPSQIVADARSSVHGPQHGPEPQHEHDQQHEL